MANFDLQTFLSDMRTEAAEANMALRAEMQSGHASLAAKIDSGQATINNHETRIVILESTRKTLRWVLGSALVAVIGGLVTVYLPKLLHP